MIAIAHPLADLLLGLVEAEQPVNAPAEMKDTSWRWLLIVLGLIGLLAWATR